MRGQQPEGPVGIAEHCQAVELRLVHCGEGNASTREAIEHEGGGASLAQLVRPTILAWADPSRAVHDDDGRNATRLPRWQLEITPDHMGGRGTSPLEEFGSRRRRGLEADAAGRPGREGRIERG